MSHNHDFSDRGYQVISQMLDAPAIALARDTVTILCERARGGQLESAVPLTVLKDHRNPGVGKEALGQEPFLLNHLLAVSEIFRAILLQKNLWDLAASILETDEAVYHFANVTRKPARIGPNLSWHRDYPNQYICPRDSNRFFRLLIPLEDMDRENGCTLALPGSHALPDEQAAQEEKKRDFDTSTAVPLILNAGDAVAIHPKMVHGGAENRSDRERNLIVMQFGTKTDDYLFWNEDGFTGLTREEIAASASRLPITPAL